MSAAKDVTGAWLDGGQTYRLHLPVKDFWAVTAYDNMSRSMVQTDINKAGVDSNQNLQASPNGSVDIRFGPSSSTGTPEGNWIKTVPGQGWFAYFRWYGPTQAFFDKTWTLPDIETTSVK